ncbi:DUF2927 domain-containing protein [Ruegeria sp.]|uniref:DUF2927 domain-containing protein n=1 Tax=Ruegeria sp. TaxID=1879320 RepID=UPI003C7D6F3B
MRAITHLKLALALAGLLALANCDEALTPSTVLQPAPAPEPATNAYVPASAASEELARYYLRVENDLLTRGMLRTDGGGPDTPYDADDLARNFEQIAFVNEHSGRTGVSAGGQSEVKLTRWKKPIRIATEFGPTVPPETRAEDREKIEAYASRLARVTGHSIRSAKSDGNFIVVIAGTDDTDYAQQRLKTLIPNIPADRLALIGNLQRPYYCFVFTFAGSGDTNTITRAVAFIRSENSDLLRLSCIHEEIAQGLGLSNDSPTARPSIFNDDDEFALLTSHDEKLLSMLYDPRLTPGMSGEEARPVVRILARELMGQSL